MLFDDKEEAESDDEASETPAKKKFNSDEALKKRKMKEDQKTKNKKAKKDTEESEDEEDKEIEKAESEYLNRPDAGEGGNDEKEKEEEERCVLTRFFDHEPALAVLYVCFCLLVVLLLPFLNLQPQNGFFYPFPNWNIFLFSIWNISSF